MTKTWMNKSAFLGMGLSMTLAAAFAGCGGQGTESSDAVVLPEPGAAVSTPSSKPAAAPAAGAPSAAPAATPASTAPVKAEGWGTLKGQIVLAGDAPTAKVLVEKGKAPKDPEVCAKDSNILSERLVVDSATKGVKNVLVYLTRPTAINEDAKKAVASANLVFDQEHCIFKGHVIAMMAGVPITLKSSDSVNHNVNAKLKNSAFNQLLAGGQSVPFNPTAAERTPGEVTCDIHPWMKAWWMVVDHPYFAVTDDKGYFEIKNVPAGTQKVAVWQEAVTGLGYVTAPSGQDVNIKPNDTTVFDLKIETSKLRSE